MTTRRERTLNYNKLVEKEYQKEIQRLHDKKLEGRMCNYNYYEHIYTLTNQIKTLNDNKDLFFLSYYIRYLSAYRIQQYWYKCINNPYNKIGKKHLHQEYNKLYDLS